MGQVDLYAKMLNTSKKGKAYSRNGEARCWILSALYGLAYLNTFRQSVQEMFQNEFEEEKNEIQSIKSTVYFHYSLSKFMNVVLNSTFSKTYSKANLEKGYNIILQTLEQWLEQQKLNTHFGRFNSLQSAFKYTGFEEILFQELLNKYGTISHQQFQFTFCLDCLELPQKGPEMLNSTHLDKILKMNQSVMNIQTKVSSPSKILCGEGVLQFFVCRNSKCKGTHGFQMTYVEPISELIVSIPEGLSAEFKFEELQTIPLIDFNFKQHRFVTTLL